MTQTQKTLKCSMEICEYRRTLWLILKHGFLKKIISFSFMHLPLLSLPRSHLLLFFPIYQIISSVNNNTPTSVGICSLSELTVPKGLGILTRRLAGWRIHGVFPSFSWVSWWKVALNGPASAMPTGQAWHRLSPPSLGICLGTEAECPVSLGRCVPKWRGRSLLGCLGKDPGDMPGVWGERREPVKH